MCKSNILKLREISGISMNYGIQKCLNEVVMRIAKNVLS